MLQNLLLRRFVLSLQVVLVCCFLFFFPLRAYAAALFSPEALTVAAPFDKKNFPRVRELLSAGRGDAALSYLEQQALSGDVYALAALAPLRRQLPPPPPVPACGKLHEADAAFWEAWTLRLLGPAEGFFLLGLYQYEFAFLPQAHRSTSLRNAAEYFLLSARAGFPPGMFAAAKTACLRPVGNSFIPKGAFRPLLRYLPGMNSEEVVWLARAASLGHTPSAGELGRKLWGRLQLSLAEMTNQRPSAYLTGLYALTRSYLETAARSGDSEACALLALSHFDNDFIPFGRSAESLIYYSLLENRYLNGGSLSPERLNSAMVMAQEMAFSSRGEEERMSYADLLRISRESLLTWAASQQQQKVQRVLHDDRMAQGREGLASLHEALAGPEGRD